AVMVTGHGSAPVQPPPVSSRSTEPGAGVPASMTIEFAGRSAAQVVPQSMPAGALVTVPLPDPALTTARATRGGPKPAETDPVPPLRAELSAGLPLTPVAALPSW